MLQQLHWSTVLQRAFSLVDSREDHRLLVVHVLLMSSTITDPTFHLFRGLVHHCLSRVLYQLTRLESASGSLLCEAMSVWHAERQSSRQLSNRLVELCFLEVKDPFGTAHDWAAGLSLVPAAPFFQHLHASLDSWRQSQAPASVICCCGPTVKGKAV